MNLSKIVLLVIYVLPCGLNKCFRETVPLIYRRPYIFKTCESARTLLIHEKERHRFCKHRIFSRPPWVDKYHLSPQLMIGRLSYHIINSKFAIYLCKTEITTVYQLVVTGFISKHSTLINKIHKVLNIIVGTFL